MVGDALQPGGAAIKPGYANDILDRALSSISQLDFIQWWPVKEREFNLLETVHLWAVTIGAARPVLPAI
jgi:hypothetical protein